jgi:hypothetical protein
MKDGVGGLLRMPVCCQPCAPRGRLLKEQVESSGGGNHARQQAPLRAHTIVKPTHTMSKPRRQNAVIISLLEPAQQTCLLRTYGRVAALGLCLTDQMLTYAD